MELHHTAVSLTDKQRQTLDMLVTGHNAKQIAKVCNITPSAAGQRIEGLLRKCQCADRGQLVRWYQSMPAVKTADEYQVGLSAEMSARSTADRLTVDLDDQSGTPVPHDILIERRSAPDTRFQKEHVRMRIEWLGHEVTWLQMILVLALIGALGLIRN